MSWRFDALEARRVGDGTFPFATDEERQGDFVELRGT
jgi:hypothetical protein